MICTPNTGHLVWGYFYALDLLSQVKKLAQHSNSIFAICNSQLLPTNQICGLLSYPKKTKNPNPSPIGNRFGFFLFGGRGWIRTTEAEKQQIYSLSPLATREHAHIHFLCPSPDDLFILSCRKAFVNCFFTFFFKCVFRAEKRQDKPCSHAGTAKSEKKASRKKLIGKLQEKLGTICEKCKTFCLCIEKRSKA